MEGIVMMLSESTNILLNPNRPLIFKNKDILSPTYIPKVVRYRDAQVQELRNYMSVIFDNSTPPHLLIMGLSGSGKTLTVLHFMEALKLQKNVIVGYAPPSKSGYAMAVNLARSFGNTIPEIGWCFESIWKVIDKSINDKIGMIFIDELDKVLDKNGELLLYYLSRRHRVSIIGISNQVTLYNKITDPSVRSSYVPYKVFFPSYNAIELFNILKDRIVEGAFYPNVISDSTLSVISAIATQRGGDARYSLDLLMTCGELALQKEAGVITDVLVYEAKDHLEISNLRKMIIQLHITSKLLLYLISLKKEAIILSELYNNYNIFAEKIKLPSLTPRRLSEYVGQLEFYGLIEILRRGKGRGKGVQWKVQISPVIDRDILVSTLKEEEFDLFL